MDRVGISWLLPGRVWSTSKPGLTVRAAFVSIFTCIIVCLNMKSLIPQLVNAAG